MWTKPPDAPGAAAGKVVFSADEAVTRSENGDKAYDLLTTGGVACKATDDLRASC